MIERLQIKNFQCHEDLKVVLDDKVTAIIGPSDVGKSAIIRALRWLATNRPRGEGFVRNGSDEAVVSAWIDDAKLSRCRGKENKYKIGEVELKAIGSDVPEDIRKILQVDEMNFQGQHESPFWFNLTGGELAKKLNAIVDLDVIDKVQAALLSRLRKVNAKKVVVKERLNKVKEKLKRLEFVGEIDNAFARVEKAKAKSQKTTELAMDLGDRVRDWEKYQADVDRKKTLSLLGVYCVKTGAEAMGLRERQERLNGLVEDFRKAKAKSIIEVPDVKGIRDLVMGITERRKVRERVEELGKKWLLQLDRWRQLKKKKEELEDELRDKSEGVCPLCGNEWKGEANHVSC